MAIALLAYGLLLMSTNPLVTVFEDEASFVAGARKPAAETLARFSGGHGEYAHPPLFDLVLHFWLRLTGESFALLRLPSIVLYCLALWVTGETAQFLWGRRWTALVLGVAWPAGYFLGRPAGWYSLAMLELAGLSWFWFRWRESGRRLLLAGWTACALALVFTNYFGWVFLAALAVDLPRQRRGPFLAAISVVAVAFVPLLPVLLREAPSEVFWPTPVLPAAAGALYLAHSLLASEMIAPWTWPGIAAAAAGLGLLWFGGKHPGSRRFLLLLAGPLAIGLMAGVLTGKRLALFAPWLLLFLSSVVGTSGRRPPAFLVGAVFTMGWLGVLTERYAGTFRYQEPWREVSARVVRLSRPGDVIVCSHPSFYFYLSYVVPWQRDRQTPWPSHAADGRVYVPVENWRGRVSGETTRLVYVRTVVMPAVAASDRELVAFAAREFHLAGESRWVFDHGARLKNRLFPNVPQPEWRIHLQIWERRPGSKATPVSAPSPAAPRR